MTGRCIDRSDKLARQPFEMTDHIDRVIHLCMSGVHTLLQVQALCR